MSAIDLVEHVKIRIANLNSEQKAIAIVVIAGVAVAMTVIACAITWGYGLKAGAKKAQEDARIVAAAEMSATIDDLRKKLSEATDELAKAKKDVPIVKIEEAKIDPPIENLQPKNLQPKKAPPLPADGMLAGVAGLGIIVVSFLGSFLFFSIPTIIAIARGHPDAPAIAMLNYFLGCTVICWWVALIWSVKAIPVRDYR